MTTISKGFTEKFDEFLPIILQEFEHVDVPRTVHLCTGSAMIKIINDYHKMTKTKFRFLDRGMLDE